MWCVKWLNLQFYYCIVRVKFDILIFFYIVFLYSFVIIKYYKLLSFDGEVVYEYMLWIRMILRLYMYGVEDQYFLLGFNVYEMVMYIYLFYYFC